MKLYEKLSLTNQMHLMAVVSVVGFTALAFQSRLTTGIVLTAIIFSVAMIILSVTLGRFTADRATRTAEALHALASGDLNKRLAIAGRDEFAWLSYEYSCTRKSFSGMVSDILANSTHLATAAEHLSTITEQSRNGVSKQNLETEQVATAMNEMSCTVQEVAHNAENAATAALEADQEARNGHRVVSHTIETINSLASEVEHTSTVVTRLKEDCSSIGSILDVIREIAEQTNLLALNAAIEAARAGEQGRGFAVVADEVRTLASRTQQSTQEIHNMIECLQNGANQAVAAMQQGRNKADESVEQAAKAGVSLENITRMIDQIKDMNTQIASAAGQQSVTAEEINRNIVNISEISVETSQGANQTAAASDQLADLALQLQERVSRFKLAE